MSLWTHAIGTVYFEDYAPNSAFAEQGAIGNVNLKEMFKTIHWGDFKKVIDGKMTREEYDKMSSEVNVPSGSEGSLSWFDNKEELINYPTESNRLRCVTFYGDLRDYTRSDNLIAWWKEFHNKMFIRQSVLQIIEEGRADMILVSCVGENIGDWEKDETEYKFYTTNVPIP